MRALIKADGDAVVRPFGAPIGAPAPAAPAEDPRLQRLRDENEELRAALADSLAEAATAVEEAREAGAREALAEAESESAKRAALLEEGLADARLALGERLDRIEGLAALISEAALAKLFDRPADQADLVASMLARQMRQLRREAVVAVRVSAEDFGDEGALERLDAGPCPVRLDPELAAGECRLDLQLGHVDVGPATQWPLLSELLLRLADEAGT